MQSSTTLDSGINVGVRLLILGLFSNGYVLIKGGTIINFFIMEKWPVSEEFYVKVETLKKVKFHKVKLLKFKTFNFDIKFL